MKKVKASKKADSVLFETGFCPLFFFKGNKWCRRRVVPGCHDADLGRVSDPAGPDVGPLAVFFPRKQFSIGRMNGHAVFSNILKQTNWVWLANIWPKFGGLKPGT